MDKKGLAVALIFLIAVSVWGGWRRDKTPEQVGTWHEPNLSAQIDIRQGGKSPLEDETARPVSSLTAFKGELDDPRRRIATLFVPLAIRQWGRFDFNRLAYLSSKEVNAKPGGPSDADVRI